MKLSYVLTGPFFFSDEGPGGKASHALGIINGLQANSVELDVIAEENIFRFLTSPLDGVTIQSMKKRGKGKIEEVRFAIRCMQQAKKNNHDILIRKNFISLILCLFTFNFRSLGIRTRIYWEVNGFSLGRWKGYKKYLKAFYYPMILVLHKFVLRFSSGIYVVSESLKDQLIKGFCSVPTKKLIVIPNGGPPFLGPCYSKEETPFKFIFFGVFQAYNAFELVCEAFEILESEVKERVELHFIGYGKEAKIIEKLANKNPNIYRWQPKIATELHFEGIASFKSVGLIPLKGIINSKFLSPIKLFDYIALGMPIIISDTAIIRDCVAIEDLLFTYETGSTASLVKLMKQVMNESSLWENIGTYTRRATNSNSWQVRMKELKLFIES